MADDEFHWRKSSQADIATNMALHKEGLSFVAGLSDIQDEKKVSPTTTLTCMFSFLHYSMSSRGLGYPWCAQLQVAHSRILHIPCDRANLLHVHEGDAISHALDCMPFHACVKVAPSVAPTALP